MGPCVRRDDEGEEAVMSNHDDLTRSADDVAIVGGGLAGLFCALKLAPRPVTVISAAPLWSKN